jgi:fatty-acyl-CoA synthase
VPDPRWGEVGRALAVLRPGRDTTPAQLLASLEGRLAKYKIPKSLVLIDALPRNPTGKVVKATCVERWGRVDEGTSQ